MNLTILFKYLYYLIFLKIYVIKNCYILCLISYKKACDMMGTKEERFKE